MNTVTNTGWQKWRFSAPETIGGNQNLVLCINPDSHRDGLNRHLHQAQNS